MHIRNFGIFWSSSPSRNKTNSVIYSAQVFQTTKVPLQQRKDMKITFMVLWVQFALQHTQTFHGCIRVKDKSILFLCYIDDVFMVWTKSEKIAEWCYDWTEPKHPSVKSNHEFDSKQIQFLDILAYIDQQNKLQATLFWNQLTVKSTLIQNQNILTHL